jgi:hypothetical protein
MLKHNIGPNPAPGPLTVSVGDRVQFARYFLQCICTPATDPQWRLTGTVKELVALDPKDVPWPKIAWDDEPNRAVLVNPRNICFLGANVRRCGLPP